MEKHEWRARTRDELIIEVWEYLDCESVGAAELEVIESVVGDRFGSGAIESPASIARLLADEGAELRHPEVLAHDLRYRTSDPYEPMFRNIVEVASLSQAAFSIRNLENLRLHFNRQQDPEGLRRVRASGLKGKQRAQAVAGNSKIEESKRAERAEIAEWFTVWLRQPEIFNEWLELRRRSKDFRRRFGDHEARDIEPSAAKSADESD